MLSYSSEHRLLSKLVVTVFFVLISCTQIRPDYETSLTQAYLFYVSVVSVYMLDRSLKIEYRSL